MSAVCGGENFLWTRYGYRGTTNPFQHLSLELRPFISTEKVMLTELPRICNRLKILKWRAPIRLHLQLFNTTVIFVQIFSYLWVIHLHPKLCTMLFWSNRAFTLIKKNQTLILSYHKESLLYVVGNLDFPLWSQIEEGTGQECLTCSQQNWPFPDWKIIQQEKTFEYLLQKMSISKA